MTYEEKLKFAFNVVVKYGFCGDCRWTFNSDKCHEFDCYQNGVAIIKQALEKQAIKQATSEWIPCDKHLPEGENEVLITVNGKFNNITFDNAVEKGFYCEDDGWIIDGYLDWITPDVTAWMTLPPAFKGE